ncbi:hypothetical protein BDZ91DRAFT_785338 [Kalaharituber pfeilii]|nr:hypothetical protein BDZ91DRAFT_785338 [Kalaharituber pfeilii]
MICARPLIVRTASQSYWAPLHGQSPIQKVRGGSGNGAAITEQRQDKRWRELAYLCLKTFTANLLTGICCNWDYRDALVLLNITVPFSKRIDSHRFETIVQELGRLNGLLSLVGYCILHYWKPVIESTMRGGLKSSPSYLVKAKEWGIGNGEKLGEKRSSVNTGKMSGLMVFSATLDPEKEIAEEFLYGVVKKTNRI